MLLFELLPGVACGGGMALAMWFVTRHATEAQSTGGDDHHRRFGELEAEIARLRETQARSHAVVD